MVTLVVVLATIGVAAVAAGYFNARRRVHAPTTPAFAAPQQLDRADFAHRESPWLLTVFSSTNCLSCRDAWDAVRVFDVADLEVLRLDVEDDKATHDRYSIEAVPTVVLADDRGVVRWSYLGAPPVEEITSALRDSGLLPGDDGTAVSL